MKNLLILILITACYAETFRQYTSPRGYVDFGVQGKTYDITEQSIYDVIIKGAKEFEKEYPKERIKKILESEVAKKAVFKSENICKDDSVKNWETDYYTYEMDYYNPMGRVIFKKGDRVIAPKVAILRQVCFIDGGNLISAKNQIDFMQKQTNGQCVFAVINRDVRDLWKIYPSYEFYPSNKMLFERFGVRCAPSILSMKDEKTKKDYFSLEKFKEGSK